MICIKRFFFLSPSQVKYEPAGTKVITLANVMSCGDHAKTLEIVFGAGGEASIDEAER